MRFSGVALPTFGNSGVRQRCRTQISLKKLSPFFYRLGCCLPSDLTYDFVRVSRICPAIIDSVWCWDDNYLWQMMFKRFRWSQIGRRNIGFTWSAGCFPVGHRLLPALWTCVCARFFTECAYDYVYHVVSSGFWKLLTAQAYIRLHTCMFIRKSAQWVFSNFRIWSTFPRVDWGSFGAFADLSVSEISSQIHIAFFCFFVTASEKDQ